MTAAARSDYSLATCPTLPGSLGASGMQCPRRQQDNLSHAKFCLECGAPVGAVAPSRSYADLQAENVGLTRSLGDFARPCLLDALVTVAASLAAA